MASQPGDPARLRLLEFLLGAEHTVGECAARIAPQNWVSAHLACLADCGCAQSRHVGRFAYYKVADPGGSGSRCGRARSAPAWSGRWCHVSVMMRS
jgi:hypothetical protein